MSGKVAEVKASRFKEDVLGSEVPVLVDFWAEWCMPCKMIAPFIDELSDDYKGKVKFMKANVDNSPELATELQILSIPALILFKGGKEITRIIGANPKDAIKRELDKGLAKG